MSMHPHGRLSRGSRCPVWCACAPTAIRRQTSGASALSDETKQLRAQRTATLV